MFRLLLSVFRFLLPPTNVKKLALENLALRQQLAAMNGNVPRPWLRKADRWLSVRLSSVRSDWRRPLLKSDQRRSWEPEGGVLLADLDRDSPPYSRAIHG
jgi:hypothetical protein